RVGYACADAIRDTAVSAAAPAARCKNCRRGSFILNPPSPFTSFDHLVGAGEQRRRHLQAERPSPLEVDYKLGLCRRRAWKVGGLLSLEDAIDIAGGPPELVDEVRSIGDQAAGGDEETFNVDCRQPVPGRQCDDQIAMKCRRRASRCDQTAIRGTRECG